MPLNYPTKPYYKNQDEDISLNMKVTVIQIVVSALGTVDKGLEELEMREPTGTIQTTALSRSTRILRTFQETSGALLFLRLP